jgi:hypothetical protein
MGLFGGSQDGAGRAKRTAEAQQKAAIAQGEFSKDQFNFAKRNMSKVEQGYNYADQFLKDRLDDGYYYRNPNAEMGSGQTRAIEGLKDYFEDGQGYGILKSSGQAAGQMAGAGADYGRNSDQLYNKLSGSATNDIQKRISQYANDPTLDAAIAANQRGIYRDLNEQALPGIDIEAAGSGNLDSSRTGIAAGIAMRGANDKAADIDAQMRNQNMARAQQLAMSDYFGANDQALAANQQVGRSFAAGQLGAQQNAQMQQDVFNAKFGASSMYQQDKQNKIDGQIQQQEWNNGGRNQSYLNDYMNTMGVQPFNPQMAYGGGGGAGGAAAGGGGIGAGLGGALSGAGAGAKIGAAIGPVGAGYGALAGGVVGGLAGLFG